MDTRQGGMNTKQGEGNEHHQKGKGVSASVSLHVCEFIVSQVTPTCDQNF